MPSLFSKKKPSTAEGASPAASSPQPSPDKEKKSRGYFVKDRDKDRRPNSPRNSKSFPRGSNSRRTSESSHPLNLHPDELRRLSAAMSSSPRSERDGGVSLSAAEPMEMTPAPETAPDETPDTNGVNGEHNDEAESRENGPAPPPHRTPASPPPPPEIRHEDAEAFKAAGNKFYKAGQYGSAIDEYTKGVFELDHVCSMPKLM